LHPDKQNIYPIHFIEGSVLDGNELMTLPKKSTEEGNTHPWPIRTCHRLRNWQSESMDQPT